MLEDLPPELVGAEDGVNLGELKANANAKHATGEAESKSVMLPPIGLMATQSPNALHV